MRSRNTDKIILEKIIGYCNDIEILLKMFGSTFENFNSNLAFRYACGMCIIQIGELTTRLTEDLKEKNPEIEWRAIKSLRNIYVHEYEKTDFKIVWDALTKEIPDLKERLQKILFEVRKNVDD